MKRLFYTLRVFIKAIALLVFFSGVVLMGLGVYDLVHSFSYLIANGKEIVVGPLVIGLLQSVDLFLVAIVFFVFSLGVLILFNDKSDAALPNNLPEWLKIKDFIQLKVILWEAILTTLVISFLVGLVERRLHKVDFSFEILIIPAAILLISISLYFLKKSEGKDH